jgi:ribosomal protein S18 acetylase RimI-like enzyme
MGLMLRPATPADEPFLFQLVHDTMAEQLQASAWDPKIRESLLKMQIEGQRISYAAQFPAADYGIIVYDDAAIGRLILDRGPQFHTLVDITLLAKHRGSGIGTWLLRAICTEAELMRKPIRLHVQATNRAKNLYQRLGFRTIEDYQVGMVMERAPGTISQMALR